MKQPFKIFLFLMLSSVANAQNNATLTTGKKPVRNQFAYYVMNGFNASVEYSSMGADNKLEWTRGAESNPGSIKESTSSPASAVGVSVSYSVLGRNSFGWSLGLGLINKVESSSSSEASMKYYDNFLQIRPEANFGFAFSNGIYLLAGGHGSILSGSDITSKANPVGAGIQGSIGYVPKRNYGFDLGYFISHHVVSDKFIDEVETHGIAIDKEQSWFQLKQLRAKFSYYF